LPGGLVLRAEGRAGGRVPRGGRLRAGRNDGSEHEPGKGPAHGGVDAGRAQGEEGRRAMAASVPSGTAGVSAVSGRTAPEPATRSHARSRETSRIARTNLSDAFFIRKW